MSKINTNVTPYYDDFDDNKNFYQVLFKSGTPVQARELNNLQSINHNQIKSLSDVNYKNGDLISGGEISYDKNLDTVLLQPLFNNNIIDGKSLINKTIKGNTTNILATVVSYISTAESEKNLPTLYIKYISSGRIVNGIQYTKFADNEVLSVESVSFAKTALVDATKYVSSAVYINSAIFYYEGYFVKFLSKSVILEQYANNTSTKIGLIFEPKFIDAQDDKSLTNNSGGYNNSVAVGADRLQINTVIKKIGYDSPIPKNFTELIKIKNGEIEHAINPTISNQIIDAIASRTYEQSGNYTIKDFKIDVKETLNNLFNNGIYNVNDTIDGKIVINKPPLLSETNKIDGNDYISIELSPGNAVVKGYNYNYQKKQVLTIPKARSVDSKNNELLFVDCGSYLEITNTSGVLDLNTNFKLVQLYDKIYSDNSKKLIGTARAVSILYENNTVRLYLLDLSTHTNITVSGAAADLNYGDYIEGTISGASGYIYNYSGNTIVLENNTGSFINNEPIVNSRNEIALVITDIDNYLIDNIKSLSSTTGFNANVIQNQILVKGNNYTVTGNTIVGTNVNFLDEFVIGGAISIGNVVGNISAIPNYKTIVIDTVFTNQNIDSLYKLITIFKSNNKNLYVSLPESPVSSTSNKIFTTIKSSSVTFISNIATIPNQNNNEISSGVVLVQTNAGYFLANFIDTNRIEIFTTTNYNGIAIVSYKVEKLSPSTSNNTIQRNKVIRYNKSKFDTNYSPFGTRYQDSELSLGFSNVENILCVRYSNTNRNDTNYPNTCFDNITVANSTSFNVDDIIYNNNIKAKIVEISNNILYIVYYNNSHFNVGDTIRNYDTQISNVVVETYSGSYIDITNNYQLVNNVSNTIFDISKLKILNKNKLPLNDVIIVFDYYKTSIGDVTTIDSYNNNKIDNKIDFRIFAKSPVINGLGNILSPFILTDGALNPSLRDIKFKSFPAPNSTFKCDYSYYLSRIDLAILDDDGVYKIISGVDSSIPSIPDLPKECLALASVNIKAYTDKIEDVFITPYANKRYTMQDIGDIDTRIKNVETEIALSKLESIANSTVLVDNNGTVRLKTGFVVDEFTNLNLSDTANNLYQSAVDVDLQVLTPLTEDVNIKLEITGSEFTKKDSLISLPYFGGEPFVVQNKHNNIIPVNSSNLINWEGVINTHPSADNWFSYESSNIKENWLPLTTTEIKNTKLKKLILQKNKNEFLKQQTIQIDVFALKPNTKLDITINSININELIVPSLCTITKDGSRGTNNIPFLPGEPLIWQNNNARSIIGAKYQPTIQSKYTQAKVELLKSTVYAGNTPLLNIKWNPGYQFELEDVKIGSYIIGASSGAIAILKNTDIISDDNGNFSGNIFIPNPFKTNYKFPTGELSIKAEGLNTFAEYKFACGGNTNVNSKSITSLRLPANSDSNINQTQITNTNITKVSSWSNPLSQVFISNENGGCFLTSLELYFAAKDLYIPVVIQIRTVENDYPTETIVPLSEISINPENIYTSTDASIRTIVEFKNIIYLKENTKYCITILSNSNKYTVYSGVFGAVDRNNLTIAKNPNIGSLYQVQNTKSWVADNTQAIKFILNKAKFRLNGMVRLVNAGINNKVISDAVTTTKVSNLVKIHCPNHGFHSENNKFTISGIQSDINPTILTNLIGDNQYTVATTISVETPELIPQLINNLPISTTNVGYLKIDNEIVSYSAVNNNTKLITVPIGGRGKNGTAIIQHLVNSVVEIYSFNGIPLTELNKTFISVSPIDLDNFGVYTINSANFTNVGGGNLININTNYQYESITPNISYDYFPSTVISAKLIGTTATSITSTNTKEPTFLPYETNILLNNTNKLNIPLMVASIDNEALLVRNSLGLDIIMSTTNENVSPIIDYDKCSAVVSTNRINNTNSNELLPRNSDSAFTYITKPISLILPSQAIVIIFDGIKQANHELKVYIKISKEDNLPEFDKNNFINVPVVVYPSSNTYQEFRYELRNLAQYKEFQIKIVGKSDTQANYPQIKNLRIISTAT